MSEPNSRPKPTSFLEKIALGICLVIAAPIWIPVIAVAVIWNKNAPRRGN